MSSIGRTFAFAVLFLLTFWVSILGQSGNLSRRSTGVVSGRLTVDGKPAPGLRVFLVPADSIKHEPVNVGAISNDDGVFRIAEAPVGAFALVVEAGGYVLSNADSGVTKGRSVFVREGEEVSGVDLILERGGVITGRVIDAASQPVIGEPLSLQRLDDKGRKRLVPLGNLLAETDDRGIYRIYGLSAGKYLVSVSERVKPRTQVNSATSIPTTFHPGVTDESLATPVDVQTGNETANIDITLTAPEDSYDVVGHVIDSETGKPLGNIALSYASEVNRELNANRNPESRTNSDGEFRFRLKPGQYVVFAIPTAANNFYSEPITINISRNDVQGLEIRLVSGASISGVMEVVGDFDPAVRAQMSQLSVAAVPLEGSAILDSRSYPKAAVSPDGSFSLTGVRPGRVRLLVSSYPTKEFSLLRVELNRADQTRGFDVGTGTSVSGVHVFLAYGKGNIIGRVRTQSGELPANVRAQVIVTPLGISDPRQSFTETDSQGQFTILNLPTGEYEIKTRVMPAPGARQFLTATQRVTVKNGTNTETTVVLGLSKTK